MDEARFEMTKSRKIFIILLGTLLVSGLMFATRTTDPVLHSWHIFFRKLYFIPILAGAVWFGLRGAITTAVVVIGFYFLHMLADWPQGNLERMEQIGEMGGFLIFSGVAGVLVRLERRAEADAEQIRKHSEREKISSVVASLSETLGARDPETRDHSRRVAELASGFARYLDLSHQEVQDLFLAGILHDIGKIGIRDDVLLKPEVLTPEEREKIMEHPRIAKKILAPVGFSSVIHYVAVHHENWDGTGYPEGIKGEDIPLPGRILAIADTYDALRSNRPYHHGIEQESRTREVMSEMAGTKLDKSLLTRFWAYLDQGQRH